MFKSLLLSFLMVISLRANALSGLISNNDTTAIVGLAMMDISQIIVVDRSVYRTPRSRTVYRTYRIFTYVPLFLAGLVLLDNNGKVTFSELDSKKAELAKITVSEMEAYNAELEELNVIKDMVSSEIGTMEGTRELKAESSNELWTEYQEYVSADAFSALVKLVKKSL